jgi:hypothetical protein
MMIKPNILGMQAVYVCLLALPGLSLAATPTSISVNTTIDKYFQVQAKTGSDISTPITINYDDEHNTFNESFKEIYFISSDINSGVKMNWSAGENIISNGNTIKLRVRLERSSNSLIDYGWMTLNTPITVPRDDLGWSATEHSSHYFKIIVSGAAGQDRPKEGEYSGNLTINFAQNI